jgi:hypothetical protein
MCDDHRLDPELARLMERFNKIAVTRCPAPTLLGHRAECSGNCDREPTFKELTRA